MEDKYKTKTGLERFYDRYPNYPREQIQKDFQYLGVGAMMIPPTMQRCRGTKINIEVLGEYFN